MNRRAANVIKDVFWSVLLILVLTFALMLENEEIDTDPGQSALVVSQPGEVTLKQN